MSLAPVQEPLDAPDDDPESSSSRGTAVRGGCSGTRGPCAGYVHPAVVDAYRDGSLSEHWSRTRTSSRKTRAERTVVNVLADVG